MALASSRALSRLRCSFVVIILSFSKAFAAHDSFAEVSLLQYGVSLQRVAHDSGAERTVIACVGASITKGNSTRGVPYPEQLQQLLGSRFDVKNFGHGGATALKKPNTTSLTTYWITLEYAAALQSQPDIVVMMLGTNDFHTNLMNLTQFKVDYNSLIDKFIGLPSSPLVLLATPPPMYDKIGVSWESFGALPLLVQAIGDERHLPVIDVHSMFLARCPASDFSADVNASVCDWMWSDRVHPKGLGYSVIAHLVAQPILLSRLPA